MELKKINDLISKVKGIFLKENQFSHKISPNFKNLKTIGIVTVLVFIAVVFLMPNEVPVEFTQTIEHSETKPDQDSSQSHNALESSQATNLWASPKLNLPRLENSSQENHNTSMVIGFSSGNAKTQLRAGIRLPLRILDKVTISEEPVPILAELLLDSQTDSGLKVPAGTRFYGEANFQKGSERASIRFSQISIPTGEIKRITAIAVGKDGQTGVPGRVFSDGAKNTIGQVLTTFVGGLATGSLETDMLGNSKGGIENGLKAAVAVTAKGRAQAYGDKLKAEREWIELSNGTECDAVLSSSLNLQEGGSGNE